MYKLSAFIFRPSVVRPRVITVSFTRSFSTTPILNQDFYKTLGVNKGANAKEIKKAYYQQAKKFHPDANKDDPNAEKKFQEVSEAYECLSDPQKRQQYDHLGSAAYKTAEQGGNPFQGGGFHRSGGGGSDPFRDMFSSIFEEMNAGRGGGGGFSFEQAFGGQIHNQPQIELGISLKEACIGVTKRVRVNIASNCGSCLGTGGKNGEIPQSCPNCHGTGTQRFQQGPFMMQQTCSACSGSGKIIRNKCTPCGGTGKTEQPKEVSIDVPAGISENERIKVFQHGHEIYVTFDIAKSNEFTREGLDIHSHVDISISQAVLGGSLMVNTLDGTDQIVIPAGTHSDTVIRISRKGSCKLGNKSYRGDHLVHLQVKPPRKLTARQREAILEFAKDEDLKGTINDEEKTFFTKAKDKFMS